MSIRLMQILVLLSGFAGLLYQVVWQKYLAIFLGSDAPATALILAGFFLYMSLGYQFFGRFIQRLTISRIKIYAYLELGIGVCGLLSPDFFSLLRNYYWASSWLQYPLLSGAILTSLCVGLPAFLMGGTIPVLAEGLSRSFEQSHQVHARVYSLNTLGAFLGALVTTFYLIEKFGLPICLMMGAVINIAVFLFSWLVARSQPEKFTPPQQDMGGRDLLKRDQWVILGLSLLSGFYVFSFENLIIRMAGVALGSSVYTYGLVVAAFILAIAVGSHLSERLDSSRRPAILALVQGALLVTSVALYFLIPYWPDLFLRIRFIFNPVTINFELYQQVVWLVMSLLLLVPVALMGMNLPLLFGYLRRSQYNISGIVGRLYSINCLGAVLGATIGGYFAFHYLSSAMIFRLDLFLVLTGLVLFIWLARLKPQWYALPVLGLSVLLLPDWHLRQFLPARAYIAKPIAVEETSFENFRKEILDLKLDVQFHREDPNLNVAVVGIESIPNNDGVVQKDVGLYLNGKADAIYPADETVRAMLPLFAASLAPKAERAAIVGLGAGLSLGISANLQTMKRVDVVEISPAVVEALPYFEKYIPGLKQNQDKTRLLVGDAFQVLRRQAGQYDFILCEPTNLWIMGVDKLYTADFFELVAGQLAPEGLFALWIPMSTLSHESFSLILTTLKTVFPYVTIWNSGFGTVSAISSKAPLKMPALDVLRARFQDNKPFFDRLKITQPETLLALQIATPWVLNGLSQRDPRVHTVEYPMLTYSAARTLFTKIGTNFDVFLSERVLRAGPIQDPLNQFVADGVKFSKEVLADVVSIYQRYGRISSGLFELKWLYMADEAGVSQAKNSRFQAVTSLRSVIENKPLPPVTPEPSNMSKVERLLRAYQRARLLGFQASPAIVMKNYDWDCQSFLCARLALGLLSEFLPLSEVKSFREKDLNKPSDRQVIFQALKAWAGSEDAQTK
ncbi:MAG: hypothetical protein AB7N80_11985 [Bdellovibrionales bacterium]